MSHSSADVRFVLELVVPGVCLAGRMFPRPIRAGNRSQPCKLRHATRARTSEGWSGASLWSEVRALRGGARCGMHFARKEHGTRGRGPASVGRVHRL